MNVSVALTLPLAVRVIESLLAAPVNDAQVNWRRYVLLPLILVASGAFVVLQL